MLPRAEKRSASSPSRARIALVQVGMTMPAMEPDLDAPMLRRWAKAVDDGPFSSLCWGERIAFDDPDSLTLLAHWRPGPIGSGW